MRRLCLVLILCAPGWLPPVAIAGPDAGSLIRPLLVLNHVDLGALELRLDDQAEVTLGQLRKSTRPGSMSFQAYGRQFDVWLTDNSVLMAPGAASGSATETPDEARYRLLKGGLSGQPDSWVRLALIGEHLSGVISDGRELYAIAPTSDIRDSLVNRPQDDTEHVIYRLSDTRVEQGMMACGVHDLSSRLTTASDAYEKMVAELRQNPQIAALTATQRLDLSAVGDLDFVGRFGVTSEAALMARFNIIDGIFSDQVDVRIRVTEIVLEEQGDGTFTSDDPGALLDQLADFRQATPALRVTGLTHLYTGRDLDEDVIGVAFLDALCSTRFGAGLSQSGPTEMSDALTGAHEIGHNFGAVHDGEAPCAGAGGIFLMAPNLNGSDRFSQCSLDTMQPSIAAASCVMLLADVDDSLSVSPESTERLLTRNVNLTFRVTQNGIGDAENVLMDISIPSALSIIDSDPSDGSCSPAAGGLSCSAGTLGPGSVSTVALTLGTDRTGNFSVGATVQADGDQLSTDNGATAAVTIQPAVDLDVSFAGGAISVERSSSADTVITVSNSDIGPASDVELTVTAPEGLDIASARPDTGTCNVSARELTCQSATLAADDGFAVTMTATGRQVGSFSVEASVSATEADLDSADDRASKTYTVTQAANAGGGGGGGGGAAGMDLILLALLLGLRRRCH